MVLRTVIKKKKVETPKILPAAANLKIEVGVTREEFARFSNEIILNFVELKKNINEISEKIKMLESNAFIF